MSNTREYDVESIVIELLKSSSALDGIQIVHQEEDESIDADRIIVGAEVKVPELPGASPQSNPIAWGSMVNIDARLQTRDADTIETWGHAIDTLLQSAPPAGVVTLAGTLFASQNLALYAAEGGTREGENVESRQRVRTVKAVWTE